MKRRGAHRISSGSRRRLECARRSRRAASRRPASALAPRGLRDGADRPVRQQRAADGARDDRGRRCPRSARQLPGRDVQPAAGERARPATTSCCASPEKDAATPARRVGRSAAALPHRVRAGVPLGVLRPLRPTLRRRATRAERRKASRGLLPGAGTRHHRRQREATGRALRGARRRSAADHPVRVLEGTARYAGVRRAPSREAATHRGDRERRRRGEREPARRRSASAYRDLAAAAFPLPGCAAGTGDGDPRPAARRPARVVAQESACRDVPVFALVAAPRPDRVSPATRLTYDRLARQDPRNDGKLLAQDQIVPGGYLLGYANADHWAVAIPARRSAAVVVAALPRQRAASRPRARRDRRGRRDACGRRTAR